MSQINLIDLPNWSDEPSCSAAPPLAWDTLSIAVQNAPQDKVGTNGHCIVYVSPLNPLEVIWSPVDDYVEVPYLYVGIPNPSPPGDVNMHVTPESSMVILILAILFIIILFRWSQE